MDELIAKLEAAPEGSRELDAEIAVAVRSTVAALGSPLPEWAHTNFRVWRARSDGKVEVVHGDGKGGLNWWPLHYTTSIDAFLPGEDMDRTEKILLNGIPAYEVRQRRHLARCRTEPLARRCAALKALAMEEGA